MAKTKTKKKAKSNEDKPLKKKSDSKNKKDIGNKKTKSATSEKSVKKKITPTKKVEVKKPIEKKPSKAKVVKEVKKKEEVNESTTTPSMENTNENVAETRTETKTETAAANTNIENPVEKKSATGETTFRVTVPELGFLKSNDGNFGVKLIAGVSIKRRDELNFEFKGIQADGTPFGTIFDCIDKNEADIFMREVLEFVKTGQIAVENSNTPAEQQTNIEQPKVEENKVADPLKTDTQVKDYKGVPLKTEDMDSIVENMKKNEQNNQQNSNLGVTSNPVANVTPQNSNPVVNIQPPISNTNTPDPNFNPTIPSQNPILTPNNTPVVNVNQMSDEQLLITMRAYANSIEDTVNNTFQVRVHGGLAMGDFNNILKQLTGDYTYELKNNGNGYFLNVNKGNYQLRVPENPESYLKIY